MPFHSRFSFHCLDIIAFFGGLELVLGKPLSDQDKSFQDLVTQHLVNFAKTGESVLLLLCLDCIVYLATTEHHTGFHSSAVISVPWLCFNVPPITFPFMKWMGCFYFSDLGRCLSLLDQQFNTIKLIIALFSCNYYFDFGPMAAILVIGHQWSVVVNTAEW